MRSISFFRALVEFLCRTYLERRRLQSLRLFFLLLGNLSMLLITRILGTLGGHDLAGRLRVFRTFLSSLRVRLACHSLAYYPGITGGTKNLTWLVATFGMLGCSDLSAVEASE